MLVCSLVGTAVAAKTGPMRRTRRRSVGAIGSGWVGQSASGQQYYGVGRSLVVVLLCPWKTPTPLGMSSWSGRTCPWMIHLGMKSLTGCTCPGEAGSRSLGVSYKCMYVWYVCMYVVCVSLCVSL